VVGDNATTQLPRQQEIVDRLPYLSERVLLFKLLTGATTQIACGGGGGRAKQQ
jgi:hypothetical protein